MCFSFRSRYEGHFVGNKGCEEWRRAKCFVILWCKINYQKMWKQSKRIGRPDYETFKSRKGAHVLTGILFGILDLITKVRILLQKFLWLMVVAFVLILFLWTLFLSLSWMCWLLTKREVSICSVPLWRIFVHFMALNIYPKKKFGKHSYTLFFCWKKKDLPVVGL